LEKEIYKNYDIKATLRDPQPVENMSFAYALNIGRCIGCRKCVYACMAENNLSRKPQIQYIRVLKGFYTFFIRIFIFCTRTTAAADGCNCNNLLGYRWCLELLFKTKSVCPIIIKSKREKASPFGIGTANTAGSSCMGKLFPV
jgi:ferredoxin